MTATQLLSVMPADTRRAEETQAIRLLMVVVDMAAQDSGESSYVVSNSGFSSFYKNRAAGRSFLITYIPAGSDTEAGDYRGVCRIEGWDNGNVGLPPITARWRVGHRGSVVENTWAAVLYGDAVDAATFAAFVDDHVAQWEYQMQVA